MHRTDRLGGPNTNRAATERNVFATRPVRGKGHMELSGGEREES